MRRTAPTARAGRAGRPVALGLALLASLPAGAIAQNVDFPEQDGRHWFVEFSHYGRWGALLAAAGFTAVAALRQSDADDVFEGLNNLCRQDSSVCVVGPDGRYRNASAEALYQETLRLDGQARNFLLGAQISILGSGVMFLVDLLADTGEPDNIPLTPIRFYSAPGRVGLGLDF